MEAETGIDLEEIVIELRRRLKENRCKRVADWVEIEMRQQADVCANVGIWTATSCDVANRCHGIADWSGTVVNVIVRFVIDRLGFDDGSDEAVASVHMEHGVRDHIHVGTCVSEEIT